MRTSILLLAVSGGVLGFDHVGHADRTPTLLIDTPFLLDGDLVTPEFYFGRISIAARTGDPAFGTGRVAELSLDGGLTFSPAQIERGAPVVRVNTQTFREQVTPTAAALDSGGFVVAWASFGNDGDNSGIFAQRYDAGGAPVGAEFQVNTTTLSSQVQPAAAGLHGGGFVIAWASLGETGGSSFEVMAQRYDAAGARVGGQFRVNDVTSNAQLAPAIGGLDDGGFVVAWQSLNQGVTGFHIFAKRYDATGAPIGACPGGSCEFRVDNLTKGQQVDPAVAGLAGGGFVVTWTGQGSGAVGDDEVYVAQYDASGAVVRPVALLRSAQGAPEQDQRTTAVARWRDGFVACWVSQSTNSNGLDVFLQAFTADGVPVFGSREVAVNITVVGDQAAPAIVNLSDGSIVVAWQDASQGTRIIRAQRYDHGLVSVGRELDVSTIVDGSVANPALAAQSDGAFAVAWEATGNAADLSSSGIFARRLADTLLVSRDLSPARDIAIQFRLTDETDPTQVTLSPVRLYRFGDPDGGADGEIRYPDGFTRDDKVEVDFVLPTIPIGYHGIQLFQRVAGLAGGACGAFGDWQPSGLQTTLVSSVLVPLDDGTCRQFKLRVVNGLGRVFEYTSLHTVAADRTPPVVVASAEQLGSILRITAATIETASGVATQVYRLNGGAAVPFDGNQVLLPLQDGGNSVRIEVADRAGNPGATHLFLSAELTAPAIDIQSIDDGATYARGPTLEYSLSQPMTQVTVLVDGVIVDAPDLSFLGAGAHTLVIRALDGGGHLVEKSVTFRIDAESFHPALLSPQARTYPEDEITVTFTADRPVVDRQILLDGKLQASPRLTGLPDGEHTVTVRLRADNDATAELVRTFRVSAEAPTLKITSPRDGQRLTSRSLAVTFESNSPVRYEIGGVGDRVVSGDILTLPAEGTQQITLTAARPGGGTLSRSITVTVDSTAPSFTVISPAPQLYAARTIPIDYTANKTLRSVVTRLDGVEVTALDSLPDGLHVLEIVGEDLDGRTARSTVSFQVAHLDIVAPRNGESVIDNHVPPAVTLQWDAGGNFTTLTAAVDGDEPQLLPADRNTAQLQLAGGPHEVVVRGTINELALARSVRFRSGARNVRVNENSIKYAFSDCTDDLICRVEVTLQIENIGEYDLAETFPVVFEVISADDTARTLTWIIAGIAANETRSATLTPFSARLDDTFRITIDPDRTIPAQDVRDDRFEVLFQPGKILQVEHSLSAQNFYISGARTDNLFAVATVGPVAFVEFTAGDLVFRDSTGEQGFVSPVDMGLLTPAANHVVIKAFDANNRLLDSRIEYFDVKALNASYPMPDRPSPWAAFRGAGNRIFVDELDQRKFARAELDWLRASLSEDAITIGSVETGDDAEGRQLLGYKLTHSDAPSLRGGPPAARAWSRASPSALQGTKLVGAFTTLALTGGACMVGGLSPITSADGHRQTVLAGLAAFESAANLFIDTELEPLLEHQIGNLFNETHVHFGLDVFALGFFVTAHAGLDFIPPNVSDVRFQFVGDIEDFVYQAPAPECDIQIVGTEIRIDSNVAFDMRFRRKFIVNTSVTGEVSAFVYFGAGWALPIPPVAMFELFALDIRAVSPTFVGAVSSNLHYRGGLRGTLPTPSLTIDEANVFLGFRLPLQTSRIAEGEAYLFAWRPLLRWLLLGFEIKLDAYAEVQAETVFDGHLRAPITLTNPGYRAGDVPDADSLLSPLGHVFAKVRTLLTAEISACIFFLCFSIATIEGDLSQTDSCQKVEGGGLVPGVPGTDCPREVNQFSFSF
jgi:hypothetical protein